VLGRKQGAVIWARIPSELRSKYHFCETPWGDGLATLGELFDEGNGKQTMLMLNAKPRTHRSLVRQWSIAVADASSWEFSADVATAEARRFGILDSPEVFVRLAPFSSASAVRFTEVPVSSLAVQQGAEVTTLKGRFSAPLESGAWLCALRFKVPRNGSVQSYGSEDVLCRTVP
jgi:hypothetical protein